MNMEKGKYPFGFSLFEVLVALVILAIGMLGIARLLMVAHKSNSSSYTSQQAVQSAYNIIDRIRANRQAGINGNYNATNLVSTGTPVAPSAPSTNCGTSICSSTEMASYDTWYWLATDVAQLPNGCGSVSTAVAGINTLVTVTVQWDDSPVQNAMGTATTTPAQLIIQSQL